MRKRLKMLAAGLVLIVFAMNSLASDSGFFLRGGDRVLFLGDSITEQKLYTTYIEAYTVTRFPKETFNFWNSGWGGDTAWLRMRSFPDEKALFAAEGDAQQKLIEASVNNPLKRDVLSFKPTVILINFGMNDHNYEAFREDIFKAYIRSQTHLVKSLSTNNTRVVLLTPQPLEPRSGDPSSDVRNKALGQFAGGLQEVAAKEGAAFVNQFDPYMAIMRRAHALDVGASIGGGDEIHPGPAGHTLMAAIILKQLKAQALVSSAELDLSGGTAVKLVNASGCVVSNILHDKTVLSFDRADDCLPMPVDAKATDALRLMPVLDELNRYELKVTGLAAARYDILIDGEFVTSATREELAKGWNLALTAGPITRQAQEVLALILKKNLAVQTLWEANIRPWMKKERPALQQKVAEAEALVTAACQTKPHRFELKPSE